MIVQQILKGKDTTGVLYLKPDAAVSEAAKVMSDKRIGTMVVSTNGKTADGILSERDIVREIGKRGVGCIDDKVSDLMTPNPITCTPNESADRVLEIMTEGRFRHLPVMENDEMIGLISIGDVVKARLAELSMEKDALQGMIMGH
ncbi:CBS domain-containing protein [Aestuariibius sp. HNIBRBA575]|uniref:CBS domain-containing protein n=1 Tax=Aestuariibius sp. HNIBRBA575 TaxID=3233343 RepID=UPI0034A41084